jgi:hypothetical protein
LTGTSLSLPFPSPLPSSFSSPYLFPRRLRKCHHQQRKHHQHRWRLLCCPRLEQLLQLLSPPQWFISFSLSSPLLSPPFLLFLSIFCLFYSYNFLNRILPDLRSELGHCRHQLRFQLLPHLPCHFCSVRFYFLLYYLFYLFILFIYFICLFYLFIYIN